jgi:hypothetical protein
LRSGAIVRVCTFIDNVILGGQYSGDCRIDGDVTGEGRGVYDHVAEKVAERVEPLRIEALLEFVSP